ncbi:hypothetical protein C8R46DRAFT_1226350 [Mycena filopes]|nr:hypothetical protein C8R46DRAFT_1226350 [Mycena filopes]
MRAFKQNHELIIPSRACCIAVVQNVSSARSGAVLSARQVDLNILQHLSLYVYDAYGVRPRAPPTDLTGTQATAPSSGRRGAGVAYPRTHLLGTVRSSAGAHAVRNSRCPLIRARTPAGDLHNAARSWPGIGSVISHALRPDLEGLSPRHWLIIGSLPWAAPLDVLHHDPAQLPRNARTGNVEMTCDSRSCSLRSYTSIPADTGIQRVADSLDF